MTSSDISSVGDHFMIGLRPGTVLDPRDRRLLQELKPAGVILFKSNFRHDLPYAGWLDSHAALVRSIREACGRDRVFIAIDHEGGRVCRTPPPITRFAYAARWAATADKVGEVMGEELASLGVNLNFAPVLDINSNPQNPVIGARAFGATAEAVIGAALPFFKSMERHGVRGCGKHFPGHGDTKVDSHRALPVLDLDEAALEARELRPFRAAVASGIGMIMTSHILIPAIDPDHPVTLSPRLIAGLLRQKIGFGGVIVSDDVGMHAMDGRLDAADAGARFLAAGNDMLMICSHLTDTERARGFAGSMVQAIASGALDPSDIAASKKRIRTMLEATPQHTVRPLSDDVLASHRNAGTLFDADTVEVV